ncbi:MAG: iron-sulfur cluster biosynthesis family protein, partial [Bacteroidota bacterium]
MAEVIKAPVQLTDSAAEALKNIRVEENIGPEMVLRVGVKGGGCSGLSYVLDFDEKNEFDQVFELKGLTMVMDESH